MNKLCLILSLMGFLASPAGAVSDWEGDYTLANGTRITRRPSGVIVDPNGPQRSLRGVRLPQALINRGGFRFNDVNLSMQMEQLEFRQEVSKLGKIKVCRVTPPEAGDSFDLTPKAPALQSKTKAKASKGKRASVNKKRSRSSNRKTMRTERRKRKSFKVKRSRRSVMRSRRTSVGTSR